MANVKDGRQQVGEVKLIVTMTSTRELGRRERENLVGFLEGVARRARDEFKYLVDQEELGVNLVLEDPEYDY